MVGCQNEGPFLGTLNNRCRCRIIIGTQEGAIIFDNHLNDCQCYFGVSLLLLRYKMPQNPSRTIEAPAIPTQASTIPYLTV